MFEEISQNCLNNKSKDPYEILQSFMDSELIPIHGPQHHLIVGASLLTAYKNSGGNIDLEKCLDELLKRAALVPGAACAHWGVCGAAISTSQVISIIANTSPLSKGKEWTKPMDNTIKILNTMSNVGGPRCCKRNSFISIQEACEYIKDIFNIEIPYKKPVCKYFNKNKECLHEHCPFNPNYQGDK